MSKKATTYTISRKGFGGAVHAENVQASSKVEAKQKAAYLWGTAEGVKVRKGASR